MKPIILKQPWLYGKIIENLSYAVELEQDYLISMGDRYYPMWGCRFNGEEVYFSVRWKDIKGNPIAPEIFFMTNVDWVQDEIEIEITDLHPKYGKEI